MSYSWVAVYNLSTFHKRWMFYGVLKSESEFTIFLDKYGFSMGTFRAAIITQSKKPIDWDSWRFLL